MLFRSTRDTGIASLISIPLRLSAYQKLEIANIYTLKSNFRRACLKSNDHAFRTGKTMRTFHQLPNISRKTAFYDAISVAKFSSAACPVSEIERWPPTRLHQGRRLNKCRPLISYPGHNSYTVPVKDARAFTAFRSGAKFAGLEVCRSCKEAGSTDRGT